MTKSNLTARNLSVQPVYYIIQLFEWIKGDSYVNKVVSVILTLYGPYDMGNIVLYVK